MPTKDEFLNRFPALGSRDFLIFWVGQFISLIGTWMQSTTLPYLAYRLTGSRMDLGLIGAVGTLPTLILALPAGVWVERLDKRKIVIILQVIMMLQSLSLAALTLSGQIQMSHILFLTLVMGIANAIEITARQAMLIELVGKERLPNAIALQATIFNSARVLGPSLAAPFLVLIGNNGEGWAFLANGISYLFVILGLFIARTPFKSQEPPKKQAFLTDLSEGFQYILATPTIGLIILMAAIIGLIGFPFTQQIPAVARDVLAQVGDTASNTAFRTSMLYTFQGIGALAAALILAAWNPFRKGLLLTSGQSAFIIGLILMGLTSQFYPALALIMFIGWGMVTQLATMNTLIQLQVPNELRGRVFSTYLWALQGVAPFGSLLIGWMAQTWGISTTAVISGAICLLAIGSIHLFNPTLRRLTA